jgi:protein gp37
MGKNSHIEWTNHTFNPWWGCAKVSPACQHCYAEAWAKRVGKDIWGPKAPRRFFGEDHWKEPLKWNAEATEKKTRFRVFCASMADVFEQRSDLRRERLRLWDLIEATPALDWLLLTKRPHLAMKLAPWKTSWPENIWLGTTVENQQWADKRLPWLLESAAKVRFLSCEPLLGEIDLSAYVRRGRKSPIHWVIAGGESGPHSRPMHPSWVRHLRDFCRERDIAFHFKQWGHWAPLVPQDEVKKRTVSVGLDETMIALGKWAAGRLLDGATHDEFPVAI